MNYREKMRKAVECPQFGNLLYGEWGTLNLNQRRDIKRLLDEMDRADEVIKTLYFKNENLQSKIDKINQYIKEAKESDSCTVLPSGKTSDVGYCIDALEDIEDILKDDK